MSMQKSPAHQQNGGAATTAGGIQLTTTVDTTPATAAAAKRCRRQVSFNETNLTQCSATLGRAGKVPITAVDIVQSASVRIFNEPKSQRCFIRHKASGLYMRRSSDNRLVFESLKDGDSSFVFRVTSYTGPATEVNGKFVTVCHLQSDVTLKDSYTVKSTGESLTLCDDTPVIKLATDDTIDTDLYPFMLGVVRIERSTLMYELGAQRKFVTFDSDSKRLFLKEYNVPHPTDLAKEDKIVFDFQPVPSVQASALRQQSYIEAIQRHDVIPSSKVKSLRHRLASHFKGLISCTTVR